MALMTNISTAPASLADMLRNFSIEVNPGETKVIDAAPQRLDPGTEVFMTWIPGKNPMDTVGPAKKLREAGLLPRRTSARGTWKALRSWKILRIDWFETRAWTAC